MIRKAILYTSLLLITLASACTGTDPVKETSTTPEQKDSIAAAPYAGKVFFFAPKLDQVTCEVFGDCDCCWDNVLFIDDYRFVRIYYCESDKTYRRGTYTVRNDSVFLVYNSIEIGRELNWDYEEELIPDSTLPYGFSVSTDTIEDLVDTLFPVLCGDQKRLKTISEEEAYFGQPDIIRPLKDYLKELQDDSIIARLSISL
ncbi:MAG: hypothetical protein V4616_11485 [Bacteroidota bacterium]